MNVKQVIVVRTDLRNTKGEKIRTGKLIAQACHASNDFLMHKILYYANFGVLDFTEAEAIWMATDYKKVVLKVDSEQELIDIHQKALENGLYSHMVTDLGYTEFAGPTKTCVAIGPDFNEKIDAITKGLSLL
jgi:PTH2 family peptidyl-tRNA hydrolase